MTRTNYVYGEPSLLVKQCVRNSWSNNVKKHDINLPDYIKSEQKKLKGCFIPHLFFGYSDSKPILSRICDVDRLNMFTLDMAVKKIIISGYITQKVVSEKLRYYLEDMEVDKIRDDIINAVLDPVLNGEYRPKSAAVIESYKQNFIKNYVAVILDARHTAFDGWRNCKPSKKVQDMFKNGYVYGKRDTSSKKWNWLKDKTPEEVADRFIENGVFCLDDSQKTAIKRVNGLSIKAVNDILKEKLCNMPEAEKTAITTKKDINDWFNGLQDDVRTNLSHVIHNASTYDKSSYVNLLTTVYGYRKEWINDGKCTLTKEIKAYIDKLYNDV